MANHRAASVEDVDLANSVYASAGRGPEATQLPVPGDGETPTDEWRPGPCRGWWSFGCAATGAVGKW